MNEISIFKGIDEQNVKSMLKCFEAKTIVYKKDTTVISNLANTNIIGIIIDGTANLVRSDYDGNRVVLEKLEKGSIFGEVFTSYSDELSDLDDAVAALEANQARLGYAELHSERNIAKLSIVCAGMMSNPGVAAKMFESLYNEGVNINMISTSEIRVTVLINEKDGVRAMNAVHDAFNLAD